MGGFRRRHSAETLLLRLLSDCYGAMDGRRVTLLALFDISAAFDTVDHQILIKHLSFSFEFSALPLDWITSFLAGRSSCVVLGTSRSLWVLAPFGLPQGSVLAPLLYLLYTSDIGPLLSSYGALSQLYINDTQAYLHCPSTTAMNGLTDSGVTRVQLKPGQLTNSTLIKIRPTVCNLNLKLSLYLFWQMSFLLIQKRKVGNYILPEPLLEERSDRLPRADRLLLGGWCKTKLSPPDHRYQSTQCAVGQEANAEHQS